jgi:hypothetical protein
VAAMAVIVVKKVDESSPLVGKISLRVTILYLLKSTIC